MRFASWIALGAVFGVALGGGVAGWVHRRDAIRIEPHGARRDEARPPVPRQDPLVQLRLAALQRQVDALESSRGAAAEREPSAPQAQASESSVADPDAEDLIAAERIQAQRQLLSRSFEREPRDLTWSRQAVEQWNASFSRNQLVGHMTTDCKKSLCRVDFEAGSTQEAQELLAKITLSAPWSGEGWTVLDTKTHAGVVYWARPDHHLPASEL